MNAAAGMPAAAAMSVEPSATLNVYRVILKMWLGENNAFRVPLKSGETAAPRGSTNARTMNAVTAHAENATVYSAS